MGCGTWENSELASGGRGWQILGLGGPQREDMKHVKIHPCYQYKILLKKLLKGFEKNAHNMNQFAKCIVGDPTQSSLIK